MNSILGAALLFALSLASASASPCYGTPAQGRLQGGVQLPADGQNYVAYSSLGVTLGRTYVHQTVRDIIVDAYAAKMHHVKIKTVIFQKELTELLFQTKRGKVLRDTVPFMKTTPWIKHDEHYHVDFSLQCRPLREYDRAAK